MASCYRHVLDVGHESCRPCRQTICHECVVDVPRLGIFCRPCAIKAAGIRMSRREVVLV